jgi:hypothetical protein
MASVVKGFPEAALLCAVGRAVSMVFGAFESGTLISRTSFNGFWPDGFAGSPTGRREQYQ